MSARLLLLYNSPVLPEGHRDAASERDAVDTMERVAPILAKAGFDVTRLGIGLDFQLLVDRLRSDPPDAVFNLFEGLADRPATESTVAGILEWFHVPFTGCGSETLTLARDKLRTKYLLRGAGLPTAPFFSVERLPCPICDLRWPVIVKPANQDASVGIEQGSVVTNQTDLEQRVEFVLEQYGSPVLVEEFITGRELFACVIGEQRPRVLPFSEIAFKDPSLWPIYSYAAKWTEGTREFDTTPELAAVQVDDALADRLRDVALTVFRLLKCRDYARVDFRVSKSGEPFVLELNPNPYLFSVGLVQGFEAGGRPHSIFVEELARAALERRRRQARNSPY